MIPEEILRSELKREQPVAPQPSPGMWGLPGLPPAILELFVRYGPILILAVSVLTIFSVAGMMFSPIPPEGLRQVAHMLVAIAASVGGVLAYMWLKEGRRLGWNMLAVVLVLQMGSGLLLSGQANILINGFEVIMMAYIMLQLRDSYTK